MTMAGASMPFRGRPFSAGLLNSWGHWGSQLLIGTIGAAILLRLRPFSPGDPMALLAPVALMALVIASWVMMRKHDRRLCEHCMSSMPLDASHSAIRFQRRLATAHLGANKPLVVVYFVALIGSAFLPGTIGMYIWIGMQLSMVYLLLSYTTHRRLQPWCRACQGGNGEDDTIDSPDPVPHGFQNA